MSVTFKDDSLEGSESVDILDFTIDTSGVNLFTTNCTVVESKQNTYNLQDCTTVDCTTVQCTTVNCTTIDCTTINCTTVKCTTNCSYDNNCRCDCNDN